MTYNVLDNMTNADNLRTNIILEAADLEATIDYNNAVNRQPDEGYEPSVDDLHLQALRDLLKALNKYLEDKPP